MFNIGPTELIVILIIALVVFGPKRLPEVGRTVGKSLREFRKASQDLRDELNLGLGDDDLPATRPAPGEPGAENWRTSPVSSNGSDSQAPADTPAPPPQIPAAEPPAPEASPSHPHAQEPGSGQAV